MKPASLFAMIHFIDWPIWRGIFSGLKHSLFDLYNQIVSRENVFNSKSISNQIDRYIIIDSLIYSMRLQQSIFVEHSSNLIDLFLFGIRWSIKLSN